jgi:hypothetical protein
VIVRYLRSRPGTTLIDSRALTIGNNSNDPYNVIVDHSSFSWSGDELVIAWYATQRVTFQWNIFAESLPSTEDSVGLKGPNLGSDGGGYYSFHHNLVAHHLQRSPNISASGGPVDVVNNLIYNLGGIGSAVKNGARVNYVDNYIKAGPNTHLTTYIKDELTRRDGGGLYLDGNVTVGDNQHGQPISFLPSTLTNRIVDQPFAAPAVTTTTADVAYEQVLNGAGTTQGLNCDGSWFFRRDPVDERIVQSVREGTNGHSIPEAGYIRTPADVGGWPTLAAGTACIDTDHDGMPDMWEVANGLNPHQDDSAQDKNGNGYTNIEEYLNGMKIDSLGEPGSKIYLPTIQSSTP